MGVKQAGCIWGGGGGGGGGGGEMYHFYTVGMGEMVCTKSHPPRGYASTSFPGSPNLMMQNGTGEPGIFCDVHVIT